MPWGGSAVKFLNDAFCRLARFGLDLHLGMRWRSEARGLEELWRAQVLGIHAVEQLSPAPP